MLDTFYNKNNVTKYVQLIAEMPIKDNMEDIKANVANFKVFKDAFASIVREEN